MSEAENKTALFSSHRRTFETEDEITLVSVGVDIGSSTSHLVFSEIVLERRHTVYAVTSRRVLHASDVILTPYADATTIDANQLQDFVHAQYRQAGLNTESVDSGALILTGVAVRRRNAWAIGELFADQAGKFVAVSAGDSLEATLVAHGSGAIALSRRDGLRVLHVDIGGGTSKIVMCTSGSVSGRTVIDVGARIIRFDDKGRLSGFEEAGKRFAAEADVELAVGRSLTAEARERIVDAMARRLSQAMGAEAMEPETQELLRLEAITDTTLPDVVTFSGGVSEYIYGTESGEYGDLGSMLAAAVRRRIACWQPELRQPLERLRATVIGASQYTVQLSGSTIFVAPQEILPLRNIAAIRPDLPLGTEELNVGDIAAAVDSALKSGGLPVEQPVAICFRWAGSATYRRLDAFCRGVIDGLAPMLAGGLPLVLVTDSDIGGLAGLHCREERGLSNPVVSIDGITLNEFEFIDIGALLDSSGTVPVVIKSLVFPASPALGIGTAGRAPADCQKFPE